MANSTTQQGWTSLVVERLSREGIFALLFIGLLCVVGYVIWGIGNFAKDQAASYLDQQRVTMEALARGTADNAKATANVGEAIAKLVEFHADVATVHSRQQDTLDQINLLAATANSRDEDIAEQLLALVGLMDQANTMMSGSVEDRRETQLVLERIDQGIIDLNEKIKRLRNGDMDGVPREGSDGR